MFRGLGIIASGLGGCEGSLGRRCARGSELRGACAGQVLGGREGGWYKCWESERERGVGTVEVLGVREESWYC